MSQALEHDIVLWSEEQATRLRRVARGEPVNDIDWPGIIEEIEAVGRSEVNSVRSLLVRCLEHVLKAAAWPDAPSLRRWLHEARVFRRDACRQWTPSMRQHVALDGLYADARASVLDLDFEEGPPLPLPEICPLQLDDVLRRDAADLAAAVAAARQPD